MKNNRFAANFIHTLPRLLVLGFILLGSSPGLHAEDYQWSIAVDKVVLPGTTNDHPRAFLWIPPNCKQVRAIVIGQNNMEEPTILADPKFRKAMSELGFAEIFINPHLGSIHFRYDLGAGEVLEQLLNDFGKVSGYQELPFAPLVPIGHSAMAMFPFDIGLWQPERTLAALSISGMWPYFHDEKPGNPHGSPVWGDRNIDGVPFLVTKGEYEVNVKSIWDGWYGGVRGDFATRHPKTILTQVVEPGYGHFEISDEKIDFLILYLRKAAQYRLPDHAPLDDPVVLKPINVQDGWLYDGWRLDQEPTAPADAYNRYQGKKTETFFAFDKELVQAIEKFQSGQRGKKLLALSFKTKSGVVPHVGDHVDCHPPFEPLDDGITFQMSGVFLDRYPWASGKREEHPFNKGDLLAYPAGEENRITARRICGAGKQTGTNMFAVTLDRTIAKIEPAKPLTLSLWLDYPGNDQFKGTVQQGEVKFWPNAKGQTQEIQFPPIPDQPAGSSLPPVKLQATSSAGLPVHYFVREGPAEVDDEGKLIFTPVPPRSVYPIKVTVVAWQWGRSTPPLVQTAPLVGQTFMIMNH
jgi:hypothetical protein